MRMIFALILIVALCAGCASGGPKGGKWCHPTADFERFERDRYECKREADMRQSGEYDLLSWPNYFNECMRMKGYRGCGETG